MKDSSRYGFRHQRFAGRPHAKHAALALYILGDLSVGATAIMDHHLAHCRKCNRRLPEVRAVIEALKRD